MGNIAKAVKTGQVKYLGVFCLLFVISACAMPIDLKEEASLVRLYFDKDDLGACHYVGDVVGSAGHWYSFLFTSNKKLSVGAANDFKNQTHLMGGNAIHFAKTGDFSTSVTYVGQAYLCDG